MKYFKNKQYISTDAFVKVKTDVKYNELRPLCNVTPIASNCEIPCTEFIKDVKQYEDKNNKNKENANYGLIVSFLLDQRIPEDNNTINNFAKKLASIFNEYPWYAFYEKENKLKYITIWFYDRKYEKDGVKINKYASHDIYKLNGKICKKSTPGAKLYIKKGEIISCKKHKYSNKNPDFSMPRVIGGIYKTFCLKMRTHLTKMTHEYFDFEITETVSFRKFNIKKETTNVYEIIAAKQWNNVLNKMDDKISELINGLKYCKTYTTTTKNKIVQIVQKYSKYIEQKQANIKIDKHIYKIEISLNKTAKQIKANSEMLLLGMSQDISKILAYA